MEFTQETIQAHCRQCGETFEGISISGIQSLYCDPCVDAYETRLKSMSLPGKATSETKSCVPAGYQDFDESKLPAVTANLAHSKIFTWNFQSVGVGIGGPSGIGKSYVIFELARRWQEAGKRVAVIKDQDIARIVRENSPERDKLMFQCASSDLIVWDDFGLSKMTDAVEGTYNDLLEKANSRNLPILGTCNYGGEQTKRRWAEQMKDRSFLDDRGERIVRRFRERCQTNILNLNPSNA